MSRLNLFEGTRIKVDAFEAIPSWTHISLHIPHIKQHTKVDIQERMSDVGRTRLVA